MTKKNGEPRLSVIFEKIGLHFIVNSHQYSFSFLLFSFNVLSNNTLRLHRTYNIVHNY